MSGQRIKFEKIPIWSVVLGMILLCGVLSMTYGFYKNSEAALYLGLAVTILGAFNGIFFLVVQPGEIRMKRRRQGKRRAPWKVIEV
jgi:uncharacterized membrane protein HdeD (DUF308 family)